MPPLTMRRFEIRVLKDKTGTDPAQVPASGAVVAPCRQSAIVATTTSFAEQETKAVPVRSAGRLQVGDDVQPGTDGSREFQVIAVGETTITLQNLTPDTVTLQPGERLIAPTQLIQVFSDPLGVTSLSSVTTDSEGFARFYCPEARCECLVTGSGLTSRIHWDAEGGWGRSESAWLNAKDYPSIQAAIDALPAVGGTVFIPSGLYTLSDTLYTPCDRPCHLLGESRGDDASHGVVLQWSANIGMLRARGNHSSFRGLVLKNTSSGLPADTDEHLGYGVALGRRSIVDAHPHPGTSATDTEYVKGGRAPLFSVLLEDFTILNARGWAIYIPGYGLIADENPLHAENGRVVAGAEAGTLSFWIDLKRVRAQTSGKFGLLFIGKGCTTTFFEDCALLHQGYLEAPSVSYYAYLAECVEPVFERCTFEGLSQQHPHPWIRLYGTEDPIFDSCWFENDLPPSAIDPSYFLQFANGCRGGAVRHCRMGRAPGSHGFLRLIQIEPNGGAMGLTIMAPSGAVGDVSFDPAVQPHYKEQIDLGGDGNRDITVLGAGHYIDTAQPLGPTVFPIQYQQVPRSSTLTGRLLHKVPGAVDTDLTADSDASLASQDGSLVMNPRLSSIPAAGPFVGALMYRWGGAQPGWRLSNNAPSLTNAQRDARTNYGTGWKTVALA